MQDVWPECPELESSGQTKSQHLAVVSLSCLQASGIFFALSFSGTTSAAALLLHEHSCTRQYWSRSTTLMVLSTTLMVLHILVLITGSLFLCMALWKLMAIELWLSFLTESCVHGDLMYVHGWVCGITDCQIPQILGSIFMLTCSVTMSWCLPFLLYCVSRQWWFGWAGPNSQNLHSAVSVPACAGSWWRSMLACEWLEKMTREVWRTPAHSKSLLCRRKQEGEEGGALCQTEA